MVQSAEGKKKTRTKQQDWEIKDEGGKDLERKQPWAVLQVWIYENIGPKQDNMAASFHTGALAVGHYYSNCWHLNEMWYNWVSESPLKRHQ
jgi:hypothetical protein